ncbi:uncharacterized protein LOC122382234 [Amphibalanus amphitrite]|uniref:uncharacterized protein LOC122382234 n=1 Tax=Amphibalanus amphitrite TaxID=1232801 RepID=UPI001C921CD3|nr:uncharacterized protein LOC122382234 [Amphibalanus amphitrite]
MDTRTRNKRKYVRILWDDTSRGSSHYVPLSSIPGYAQLKAKSRVRIKYGKTVWTGTVCQSRKSLAAESLLGDEPDVHTASRATTSGMTRATTAPPVPGLAPVTGPPPVPVLAPAAEAPSVPGLAPVTGPPPVPVLAPAAEAPPVPGLAPVTGPPPVPVLVPAAEAPSVPGLAPVTGPPPVPVLVPVRKRTREWYLPSDRRKIKVCKGYFLTSLGMKPTNDTPVRNALEREGMTAVAPKDRRGDSAAANKCDREAIKEHIMSFEPAVPHYRYLHAPNRRYLPPELSVCKMYRDFKASRESACSFETYRKVVKDLNIGFTHLSGEECETCKLHAVHKGECSETEGDGGCEVCTRHRGHMAQARRARQEYRYDAERDWDDNELVLSADMMKVCMLPILPHKTCLFTRRIVAYNETFSLIQSTDKRRSRANKERGLAVLWHEGVSERKAGDVASSYLALIKANRDTKQFTIFCDNCSSQNKCWVVLSVLLHAVQSSDLAVQQITLKYLTTGHTAMSADADHQVINKSIKRKKSIEDFNDFVETVASTGLRVKNMSGTDFVEAENVFSEAKIRLLQGIEARPYLRDFQVVQVRKGSGLLYTKSSFDQSDWKTYNLLKAKVSIDRPLNMREKERCVNKQKIDQLCDNLLSLISSHKRSFWVTLKENAKTSVRDLIG